MDFGVIVLFYFQFVVMTCAVVTPEHDREPQCYSRFDYEYKVVQKIVALENMYNELKTKNSELRMEIESLKSTNEGLKSSEGEEPTIAFLAVLNVHRSNLAGKATIVFDTAITNLGNGYNSSDGVFTAPYSGTYLFSATILADNGGEVWSQFMLNEEKVAHIYARASDGRHDQGSNTVILQLSKGDRVYVQNYHKTIIYGSRYSSFSGALLKVIHNKGN